MSGTNLPWGKFVWADWRTDMNLRLCSLAARGLWVEMLCLMAMSESPGYLRVGGKMLTTSDITNLVGATQKEVNKLVIELENAGVFSRAEDGTIYCRRMIREAEEHERASAAGAKGGNPNIRRGTVPKEERARPYRRSDAPQKTQRIFMKNNGCCWWCSKPLQCERPGPDFFQVDHVIATRDGGTNDESNLVPSCASCNHDRARHATGNGSGTNSDSNPSENSDTNRKRTPTLNLESESESERESPRARDFPPVPPAHARAHEADGTLRCVHVPPRPGLRVVASARPLPEDWEPSGADWNYALDRDLNPAVIRDELRNWAGARAEARSDWGAMFRRFCDVDLEKRRRRTVESAAIRGGREAHRFIDAHERGLVSGLLAGIPQ